MRAPLAILCLCALALAGPAAAAVYRWVDAQAQVHYSQTPPRDGPYQRIETPEAAPRTAPALEAIRRYNDAADAQRQAARTAAQERQQAEAARSQRCQAARQRLGDLDQRTAQRLLRVDENGQTVRYTQEMFQAERDRAQALIDENCD